jgi:branched-chain amino acid transport system ATP-binding protein
VTGLLQLRDLRRDFGSLCAVEDVNFSVQAGARHALIGPNGAGKSTLFNLVAGSLPASSGAILFDGRDITRIPEHTRARLGIARTFQHSAVFLHGTAVENVLVGVARKERVGASWFGAALRRRALVDRCVRLLDLVGLEGRYATPAGNLSHGERRQLELAMALGTEPRLLLLDEPAAGMSQAETTRFTELIAGLPPEVTVLLIEHDLDVVFELADTVTVLHLGRHLATGSPEEIRGDSEVQRAYLGTAELEDLFETAESDS